MMTKVKHQPYNINNIGVRISMTKWRVKNADQDYKEDADDEVESENESIDYEVTPKVNVDISNRSSEDLMESEEEIVEGSSSYERSDTSIYADD